MKQTLFPAMLVAILSILLLACGEPSPISPGDTSSSGAGPFMKKPQPPPPNANPKIAYTAGYTATHRNKSVLVRAVYVMDANGSNKTMVHADYTIDGNNIIAGPGAFLPTWSADGQKLCFMKNSSLYTMTVSLVNGIPTGSNVTKIVDGPAGGVSYRRAVWRPGAAEIAAIEYTSSGLASGIRIFSTSGTPQRTVYTPASGSILCDYLTYSPDGAKLALLETLSSGDKFLRIIDAISGALLNSFDLAVIIGDFSGLDWQNASGSTVLAFSNKVPDCSGSRNNVYLINVAQTTGPVLLFVDGTAPTWSSDDLSIGCHPLAGSTGPCQGNIQNYVYSNVAAYSIAAGTKTLLCQPGQEPDWKR